MDLQFTFDYAGWKIRYTVLEPSQPTKHTIVFVHGTPWSSVVFKTLVQSLQAKSPCRILLYDLPGYGQSQSFFPSSDQESKQDLFTGDTSVFFQAKALSALLQALSFDGKEGHTAPSIIAHDIAGTIVLRAHLIHNCDFKSMLLMDTNAVLPWGDGFYKLVRSEPEVFLKLPAGIFEAVVKAVTKSAVHAPRKLDEGWEEAIVAPWIGDSERQESFVRQIAQANDGDIGEMLIQGLYERVRCDVKILWGEEDQWIPREKMEQLVGLLGERMKEFVTIPEAGHLIMIDQPEKVAAEVVDWMFRR